MALKALVFAVVTAFFLLLPSLAGAVDVPNFPTCSNPSGILQVSFGEGIHGIAGNPGEFTGSDSVYTVDDARTVQCFCATDGAGVQTHWWKFSSLTQEQVNQLKNEGWTYVPSGEPWGLQPDPYLALNANYSCKPTTTTTTTNTNNSNSSSNNGTVLAASTSNQGGSVLGLATTGNTQTIAALAAFSILSLGFAFMARKLGV